ncbi:MAG: ATP-binding protein [Gammaproteobacteria bacterium]|jgi:two-component system sensor histidine kinase FlrB
MGVSLANQLQSLEETFQTFDQLTDSLESNYLNLEDRVAQLQSQLSEVRRKHREEITARDSIAKKLSSVLQALPAGVVVLNPEGRVQDCNPAAIEILGGPLQDEIWRDVVERVFLPRSDDGHEISLKDGRLVNISTCPLGNDPGQILLIADVTETRRLQKYVSQHQQLISMGEMVASLAHQIRTPLSTALLSASQLKNTHLAADRRHKQTEKLIGNLRHLESLVTDMLVFSKEGHCSNDSIELSELVEKLVTDAQVIAQSKNIQLTREDICPDTHVLGNQSILLSALQNLLDNAIHAVGESGEVHVSIKSTLMGSVDVVVTDNGPGIPLDIQAKIFDPFFTTKTQGTGLGLAVVKAVTRAHQGDIWLDTDYTQGCRFVLRLPTLA